MIFGKMFRGIHLRKHHALMRRHFSSLSTDQTKIRNIGILAHIDAGKTTTTERMLFYSGKTHYMGEVHRGNTVTDFLAQERERGITICSSAVTFTWNEHRINLLDTPGHIDFTMEVEQSLNAVDGTVIILDASAGVEAQTVTVWHQVDQHHLPRIVFANKMDRADANFDQCLEDVRTKLVTQPLPIQIPIMSTKGLTGIIDVIGLTEFQFDRATEGRVYTKIPLSGEILKQAIDKRCEMIDILSGHDDALADAVISNDSLENIDSTLVMKAIRNATIRQKIVPVLLGSAYKNTGIQLLMDSVIAFLPTPKERSTVYECFGRDFAGKVFKVMHDNQRGPLSLVRVLNGSLKKGDRVTTTTSSGELIQRLYEPLADEYRDIDAVSVGNVAVCAGLKNTSTGDLLVSSMNAFKSAQNKLAHTKTVGRESIEKVFEMNTKIPDAVYFCSIEPPSISYQLPLERALAQLQREDPSLRVRYDETTLQTVLGGMGELHLEIIKSRILSEYKIDVDLGPLQIAYKETISEHARDTFHLKREIGGTVQEVTIEMSVVGDKEEIFNLDKHPDAQETLNTIRPRFMSSVKKATIATMERGPLVGGVVIDAQVILHSLVLGRGIADSFLMSATAQCIQKLLLKAGCRLLEPNMAIQIIAPADRTAQVLADLSRRRAEILDVTTRGANKVINVNAPLAELSGYSSTLRTITSGTSSMTMQPSGHTLMTPIEEQHAIRQTQGLE